MLLSNWLINLVGLDLKRVWIRTLRDAVKTHVLREESQPGQIFPPDEPHLHQRLDLQTVHDQVVYRGSRAGPGSKLDLYYEHKPPPPL